MSRIGNKPITVPAGVEVKLDGEHLTVKGPKGTLERDIHKNMTVKIEGNEITVSRPDDEAENRSLHGLTRTLIANMIEGVLNQYQKELQIVGVGYRAQKQGKKLVMNLGYSHPVEMEEPKHSAVLDQAAFGGHGNAFRSIGIPEVTGGFTADRPLRSSARAVTVCLHRPGDILFHFVDHL